MTTAVKEILMWREYIWDHCEGDIKKLRIFNSTLTPQLYVITSISMLEISRLQSQKSNQTVIDIIY